MEKNSHSLQEEKYPEISDSFFQAIEMANDDNNSELDLESDFFSWKLVKRRSKPQRRYTVSHTAPPAPPSTPTSLSKEQDPLSELSLSMSPTHHNQHLNDLTDNCIGNGNGPGVSADGEKDSHLGSLLYILDYAPKYKKKLREQRRTDAELADLFKVITITGGGGAVRKKAESSTGGKSTKGESSSKSKVDHGISNASRRIRRPNMNDRSFKIHRNTNALRDLHDDDSLSAPEFDGPTDSSMNAKRRWRRSLRAFGNHARSSRRAQRKPEFLKRMEEVIETFDSSMRIQHTP